MRKFAAFLLSAALLLTLAACGSAETDPQESTQAGIQAEDSEKNAEEAPGAEGPYGRAVRDAPCLPRRRVE